MPRELREMFDMVVMDPPFLNEECLTKESVTAKFLSKGEAKVVLCSGEVMEDLAGRLLGLKRCQFTPKHKNNLANPFLCYANYNLDQDVEQSS